MSRTVAGVISGLIDFATMPLNERQKDKTIARVAEGITRSSHRSIATERGSLQFYATRGHGTRSSVSNLQYEELETLEWIDSFVNPGEMMWYICDNICFYRLYAAPVP